MVRLCDRCGETIDNHKRPAELAIGIIFRSYYDRFEREHRKDIVLDICGECEEELAKKIDEKYAPIIDKIYDEILKEFKEFVHQLKLTNDSK